MLILDEKKRTIVNTDCMESIQVVGDLLCEGSTGEAKLIAKMKGGETLLLGNYKNTELAEEALLTIARGAAKGYVAGKVPNEAVLKELIDEEKFREV